MRNARLLLLLAGLGPAGALALECPAAAEVQAALKKYIEVD